MFSKCNNKDNVNKNELIKSINLFNNLAKNSIDPGKKASNIIMKKLKKALKNRYPKN